MDWCQKYRPSNIQEVITPLGIRGKLNRLVKRRGGISLLFWGRPGCGKTTVAELINPENNYFINCSLHNDMNTIRLIERSCSSGTVTGDGRRLIILDEADNLTNGAQLAIRGVVEKLSICNDFIMTANDPNLLSEAVRSRFLPINFDMNRSKELSKMLSDRLCFIAKNEGHENPDLDLIEGIVVKNFPDLRRMIKTLQFELMDTEIV